LKNKPESKGLYISYLNSFHGKSLGAQSLGGLPELSSWIPDDIVDSVFVKVPYPESLYSCGESFEIFTSTLKQKNIETKDIAAVVIDCYQAATVCFAPKAYMQKLATWCKDNNVLLIIDEVQSGFGRTGKWWAYEHYDIIPDIITAAKGISSSLPLSAVIARPEIIDLCELGTLNTTHSGNPVCCAAAEANIKLMLDKKLVENATIMGKILAHELDLLLKEYPESIRAILGKGLIFALYIGNKKTNKENGKLAKEITNECLKNGLMLFNPVGIEGAMIKIAPPLCIDKQTLLEGCKIIKDSIKKLK
jgi:4-aminobutyrate aminotransferase-like enzyme